MTSALLCMLPDSQKLFQSSRKQHANVRIKRLTKSKFHPMLFNQSGFRSELTGWNSLNFRAEKIGLAGKDILFQLLVLCTCSYQVFHLASQAIHILSKILIIFVDAQCKFQECCKPLSHDCNYSKILNKR